MGAEIHIKPKSSFDPDALICYVSRLSGACAASDSPGLFSIFPGTPMGYFSFRRADIADANHPRNRQPLVEITPEKITIAVNWSDSQGIVRQFLTWLLCQFECTGICGEGGSYETNAAIQRWSDTWLQ